MGTTEADPRPETPAGVIQRVGHSVSILREATADTAYGSRSAAGKGYRLYPLALLLTAVLAAGVSREVQPADVVLFAALCLLAVWVGGHR